jgi:hypothetical protein
MRILTTPEAAAILLMYPNLRVSDIPFEGMLLHDRIILSTNDEGEVTLFDLDPNA